MSTGIISKPAVEYPSIMKTWIHSNTTKRIDATYAGMIIMGYLGHVGGILLGITKLGSDITVKNLATGADWSNSVLAFSASTNYLDINVVSGSEFKGLIIYGSPSVVT